MQGQTEACETAATPELSGRAVYTEASFGFMPAFMHVNTRETHLASYLDGKPAVVHVLDGVPHYWVEAWGQDGRALSLKTGIVAGYMRTGHFYTLHDILHRLRDS
ncbi:MAG: hypothetical protein QG652_218 [Pseudomonadota bacterium]|nr:hypothetical protein [Pseudomonadota bacterium]